MIRKFGRRSGAQELQNRGVRVRGQYLQRLVQGDGLYGVDIKESDGAFYVIEVNENPNIDAGCEDSILKDELYRRIMAVFLRRIEKRKAGLG